MPPVPRNPWSNAFLLLGFATIFASIGLTWEIGIFGGELGGAWFLRREIFEICRGHSVLDFFIRVGENRLVVSIVFLPAIVFYWSRRQPLFFVLSALAGFAMSALDFRQHWYDQRDCPGHWVWCAGYCCFAIAAIIALVTTLSPTDDDDESSL